MTTGRFYQTRDTRIRLIWYYGSTRVNFKLGTKSHAPRGSTDVFPLFYTESRFFYVFCIEMRKLISLVEKSDHRGWYVDWKFVQVRTGGVFSRLISKDWSDHRWSTTSGSCSAAIELENIIASHSYQCNQF